MHEKKKVPRIFSTMTDENSEITKVIDNTVDSVNSTPYQSPNPTPPYQSPIVDANDGTLNLTSDLTDLQDGIEPMEEEDVSAERTTGQVKWFNDNDGYGFIKPSDNSGDVFVHISDLQPQQNSFKPALYTGEYVSFAFSTNGNNSDGTVRLKAVAVKGAFGGSLMCDHGDLEFKSYSRIGFQKLVVENE